MTLLDVIHELEIWWTGRCLFLVFPLGLATSARVTAALNC